jgi:ABC-type uncharacterized transport system permease subunit
VRTLSSLGSEDFLAILVLFSHLTSLGGWSLWDVAFPYGAS